MNRIFFFIFLMVPAFFIQAQDIEYARESIKRLSSEKMHGRGYVKNGDHKAARFIRKEFKKAGLESFGKHYFQEFSIPINTFPGKMEFAINGEPLLSGREFVAAAYSPSVSGTYDVLFFKADTANKADVLAFTSEHDLSGKFLLIQNNVKDTVFKYLTEMPAGLLILSEKKLIWRVSDAFRVGKFPVIQIKTELDPADIKEVSLDIKSKYIEDYQTQNVVAWIPGKKHPEKFIFFTAHYDHLGQMGKEVYFPGANDNASGTAMIMDLARYFSQPDHQPDYSIGFIAFAAEESGLHGSAYAADHPPVDLEQIEFLVNLDMVGTGSDGITIVNGKQLPDAFAVFKEINDSKGYLKEVKARGESCNSDHCMFYKKGVPAVFIYTRGKEFREYHNQDDVADALPLTEYKDLFRLLVDFVNRF